VVSLLAFPSIATYFLVAKILVFIIQVKEWRYLKHYFATNLKGIQRDSYMLLMPK
jgi:hypothetical protein